VRIFLIFLLFLAGFEAFSCEKGVKAVASVWSKFFGKADDAKVVGASTRDVKKYKKIVSTSPDSKKALALQEKILSDDGVLDFFKGLDKSNQNVVLRLSTSDNPVDKKIINFLSKADKTELNNYIKEIPGPGMERIRNKVLSGFPEDQIIKALSLEAKASRMSLYTKISKGEVELLNSNLLAKVEVDLGLPAGLLKTDTRGVLTLGDLSKVDPKKLDSLSDFISKFNNFKSNVNSNDLDKFSKYDELFEVLGIQDKALRLSLKQNALGDFVVPMRNSWEVPTIVEPVESILGVTTKYDGTNLIIKAKDVPEEQLRVLDKAINGFKETPDASVKSKTLIEQARQKRFLEAFESPQSVRESLGVRKALAPTSADDLNYRIPNSDAPKVGWERIDVTNVNGKTSALSADEISEGYKRVIYRNNGEGRSIIELRDPSGKIISQEMIVARNPKDPGKGVAFFSYEDGKLSKTFRPNPRGGHMDTGHGCMSCHGAMERATGKIVSSFLPNGTKRSLGSVQHPTGELLDKANSSTIKAFEEAAK